MDPSSFLPDAECCQTCGALLSPGGCWQSGSFFYCADLHLSLSVKPGKAQRIASGKYLCKGLHCRNLVPAGNYPFRKKAFFCSRECSLHPTPRTRKYLASGKASCEVCGMALGEIWVPRGKRHFFCSKPECQAVARMPFRRFVRDGELTCDAIGCHKSVKSGWYSKRQKHFFCSEKCRRRFDQTVTYGAGEKRCEICNRSLGKIACGRGRKRFHCGRRGCSYRSAANRRFPIQKVERGQKPCSGPGCKKSAREGSYITWKRLFFCSRRCESRYRKEQSTRKVKCSFCGKTLRRPWNSKAERFFCSAKEKGLYEREDLDRKMCGPFLELYRKYYAEFAEQHYREPHGARCEVRRFFAFLAASGVRDIGSATPSHISGFLRERRKTAEASRTDYIKVMFDWLAEIGLFDHPNPVRPKIHYRRIPQADPRPYAEAEMRFIWHLLDMRGDTRAKTIVAIGEEAGLRGVEVTRIHTSDVSLAEQTIRLRNPTKNMRAITVFFSRKTRKYLDAWLKERPECDHDFLLTNAHGDPISREAIRSLLNRVLCKRARGRREVYEVGLDCFDYHRLRHTNTTDLGRGGMDLGANMRQHNWKQPSAALNYLQIPAEQQAEQYHKAMARSRGAKRTRTESKAISIDEYLATCRKKGA